MEVVEGVLNPFTDIVPTYVLGVLIEIVASATEKDFSVTLGEDTTVSFDPIEFFGHILAQ
jgi:hypothetical protein